MLEVAADQSLNLLRACSRFAARCARLCSTGSMPLSMQLAGGFALVTGVVNRDTREWAEGDQRSSRSPGLVYFILHRSEPTGFVLI